MENAGEVYRLRHSTGSTVESQRPGDLRRTEVTTSQWSKRHANHPSVLPNGNIVGAHRAPLQLGTTSCRGGRRSASATARSLKLMTARYLLGKAEPVPLFANQVRKVFFVFADRFDQLLICHQIQAREFDGPRSGIRLRVINGDFQIDVPEIAARVAFGDVRRFALRVPIHVQPS